MFLAVLHDSGIVGLTLWLAFLAVIYRGLFLAIRGVYPRPIQMLAIGMAAVLTSLLVSAQATTSMYLLFFGRSWGLQPLCPSLPEPVRAGILRLLTAHRQALDMRLSLPRSRYLLVYPALVL